MTTLVAEANKQEAEGSHVLAILDKTGDTKVMWEVEDDTSVVAAAEAFLAKVEAGYTAYAIKDGGAEAEVIKNFDKTAEKIILTPQFIGG